MKKLFLIIITCQLLPLLLFGRDIKFEHISVEQGLSQNKVRCVLQDKLGYIWIGTEDGLNKYDGYKFTIYRNDPDDSLSLSSNLITGLYEDRSGQIWIATMGGGLNKFNREKEEFTQIAHRLDDPSGISAITIKQMAEYQYKDERVLWIGTWNGLNKMNLETQKLRFYPHTKLGHPFSHIQAVVVDKSGMVWIGSLGDGLHKFNPETQRYTHYQYDPDNKYSLSDNQIFALFIDSSGVLWIGTAAGGLNRFDPEKEQFTAYKFDPNDPRSLSSNNVISVYEGRDGVLWIGTADKGLNILNRDTQEFTHLKYEPGDPNTLNDNTIWHIYEDKTGLLWLGTWGGVNKILPRNKQFAEYKMIPGNPNSLSDNSSGPIYISTFSGSEVLWIGTRKGLDKINRKTGKYTHYIHDPNNANSIPSNLINSLFEDRSGILWIGTYGDGLIKFDPLKEQFTGYTHDPTNPNSISNNIVYSVFEDKNGELWVSTEPGCLNKFDPVKEQFTQTDIRQVVRHICEDTSGFFWMALHPGLLKLDRDSGRFVIYLRNQEAANFPELNRTYFILESQNGEKNVIWTGTYSGLNKFNRKSEKFINYSVKDGLPNNVINGILEDNQGNLWLGTNNGLSNFNPETESFRNYDVNDGLLSNQFWPGGCFKSKDGEMFFCGAKGVNAFYPDRIKNNIHIPEIVLTDFQIFNKSIKPGTDSPLKRNISESEEIILTYEQSVFSFEFTALDYYRPQKNQYAYKMEGVDPDWVHADASRRFATYTQLDPGIYNFRVKGSNNDGIWNEDGTSIKIIITPPWWKTNWAYSVYILFFGLTFYALRTYDKKRQRLKQDLEMQQFESVKLREVDQLKSRFFANISHEFRTPLTLIKGPVKQIMDGEFTGNLKEQCKMILRNSNRLLDLINQILDLSKLESGEMKLQVSETEIIKYLKGMVLSFASLAERKSIILQFKATEKSIIGFIDHDKLEKIVTNLLSNAFKFTPEKGEIIVDMSLRGDLQTSRSAKQSPEYGNNEIGATLPASGTGNGKSKFQNPNSKFIEISVSNTGAGISPDRLDKIFDRFYSAPLDNYKKRNKNIKHSYPTWQADDSYKKDSEGSGLGLALAKELVDSHHGEITVTSMPNISTTFKVIIPVDKANYSEDDIVAIAGKKSSKETTDLYESASGIPHPVSSIENQNPSHRSPILLIVEDNPDVTNYISSFMENEYRILTAENGKEGLKKSLDKYPDLIISDVMMPEMDGFELCKILKTDERLSHIPVILLTARADLDSKMEGLEFGADDYVTKPFEARELQIRSKNLIEQRRKLREKFSLLVDIKPGDISASSMDEQLLQRLLSVFEDHIEEPEFNIEHLAREVGMSRVHLNRKLHALTNLSTRDFLRTLRLQRAAQMLKNASGTVSEIAYKVGFNNLSYFSKAFSKHFGKLPSEFSEKRD